MITPKVRRLRDRAKRAEREVERLKLMLTAAAERIAAQSEILSRRAEKK